MKADAKTLGTAAAGVAGVVALAAGGYWLFERLSEKPSHRTLERDDTIEIRAYPKILVAETVVEGERRAALDAGFQRLADYIFAKSRGGDRIAMTAPVLTDKGTTGVRETAVSETIPMTAPVLTDPEPGGGWRTRFVMPGKYTRATLPPPPPGVEIAEMPARRVAAIRFSGGWDDAVLARHVDRLRDWMARHELEAGGEPEYAFYNSPYIPPFLRRNEVLIPLA